jgi:hypothetical protein
MTGDFTRDSFDPTKNFTRVLMQQGRPQLDADLNEQIAIFWRYWRTLATDLIGPFGGPRHNCGFEVIDAGMVSEKNQEDVSEGRSAKEKEYLRSMLKEPGEFLISPGRYYVNGILCENTRYLAYSTHIDPWETPLTHKKNASYLVYLDVWERPVSYLEDDQIYEPALNGIDTSIRTKVMWRVRVWELPDKNAYGDCSKVSRHWTTITHAWQAEHRGRLRARTSEAADGASHEHEHAVGRGYRGPQNQLYRVEIHHEGVAGSGDRGPTFKVSRENGSVLFRVASFDNNIVNLVSMGRDARFGLQAGDWVELCEGHIGGGVAGPLFQVQKADSNLRQVTLSGIPAHDDRSHRPFFLRRWDHKAGDPKRGGLELRDGAAILREGEGNNGWLSLERGLRIQFHKSTPANKYRTGDYWLIPARVATGGVLWPHEHGKPKAVEPHGVQHHYAPLAIVSFEANGALEAQGDCRPKFKLPLEF